MSDPNVYLTTAIAALAGLAMLCYAGLNGWRGWLQLKQQQLRLGFHLKRLGDPEQLGEQTRDARDMARKLTEAASGIRDNKIKEKIRYSKSLLGSGAPERLSTLPTQKSRTAFARKMAAEKSCR